MMKGIIDKSRLEKIGKYINRQLIVHRNIENDTKWTTEESMIVELYDNYIELISKINNLQQENQQLKEQLQQKENVINKAKEYIENNPLYDIDVYEYSICLNGIDDEQTRKELLKILDNKGEMKDE